MKSGEGKGYRCLACQSVYRHPTFLGRFFNVFISLPALFLLGIALYTGSKIALRFASVEASFSHLVMGLALMTLGVWVGIICFRFIWENLNGSRLVEQKFSLTDILKDFK
jgi:TRAP-type C4-dicarboxylate transport system permease small subunit